MASLHIPDPLWTNHFGQNSRGLSPRLWSKISAHGAAPDGSSGFYIADDFLLFGQSVAVASNQGCYVSEAGQYKSWEDTGSVVAQSATQAGGVVELTTNTTDNNQTSITQGGAGTADSTSVLGAISYDTSANRKMTIYEARWKIASVTDDVSSVFVGLMDDNVATEDSAIIDNTGAMLDDDFIGFHTLHENGGATNANSLLRFTYKAASQTVQVPITAASIVDSTGTAATTLSADTWIKTGFIYDPAADPAKRIAVFVNNVEQSTYVTAANLDAVTFPDAVMMGFAAIVKNGTTTAGTLSLDWLAYYQET